MPDVRNTTLNTGSKSSNICAPRRRTPNANKKITFLAKIRGSRRALINGCPAERPSGKDCSRRKGAHCGHGRGRIIMMLIAMITML